jgi:hypothetical protein
LNWLHNQAVGAGCSSKARRSSSLCGNSALNWPYTQAVDKGSPPSVRPSSWFRENAFLKWLHNRVSGDDGVASSFRRSPSHLSEASAIYSALVAEEKRVSIAVSYAERSSKLQLASGQSFAQDGIT